ncbi:MAG: DUF479 domain-containing protein [Bacteroidia bacterium]|nr:DUF479 domain-containing protein [Bacteroidia bacterium]
MNFLAHLYLSRHDDQLMVGNFIADSVKGRGWEKFEPGISDGILMHRKIDDYTDRHPVFRESTVLLRPHFGKFAGVVTDIYYDHFLAKHYKHYSGESLVEFTERVHLLLRSREHIMPERSRLFFQYMQSRNIPLPYAELEGISMVLRGMSRRSVTPNRMHEGKAVLELHYAALEEQFSRFFPDAIRAFAP